MPDDSMQQLTQLTRREVVEVAMQGGYFDAVMRSGHELERVKEYLRILSGQRPAPPVIPGLEPTILPPFPGLEQQPWQEPPPAAAAALERCADAVERDLARLENAELLHYEGLIVQSGRWSVHSVFYCGERWDRLFRPELAMEETAAVVQSLEGECTAFPLADVVFSAHEGGTRLTPHCSWDGFRLRLHLGLRIPEGCGIRVGTESRQWERGRVLAFQDAYEHETWNHSQERRVVLIVDCWHPGVTLPEREALLGLTRKLEVRSLFARLRMPEDLHPTLFARFAETERTDPLVRRFWRS
ncbi:aspartyl/asparaginyl beta-hydroxylase domain-containing protein [Pyxidicoccus sp. 3LFB2]